MAAGSGFTAATDATITNTIIGKAGGYSSPTNNWVSLYTNQGTASSKTPTSEWTTASDTAPYARQPMGGSGAGWTVAAFVNGTGVVWNNTNAVTQPGVQGTNQSLFSVGFCDSVGPTGGNINFFADLNASQPVNIGVQVIFAATTGITFNTL